MYTDTTRQLLIMGTIFGLLLGAGIGATIEHHFNREVVVISPICSKKEFKRSDENIPIIPEDSQDQHKL